jgi:hypothetical protein
MKREKRNKKGIKSFFTTIGNKITNNIKNFDKYGQSINLNINGNDSYGSVCGGLLSLFVFIYVFFYSLLKLKYMVQY